MRNITMRDVRSGSSSAACPASAKSATHSFSRAPHIRPPQELPRLLRLLRLQRGNAPLRLQHFPRPAIHCPANVKCQLWLYRHAPSPAPRRSTAVGIPVVRFAQQSSVLRTFAPQPCRAPSQGDDSSARCDMKNGATLRAACSQSANYRRKSFLSRTCGLIRAGLPAKSHSRSLRALARPRSICFGIAHRRSRVAAPVATPRAPTSVFSTF
jgi:hypothetical protein